MKRFLNTLQLGASAAALGIVLPAAAVEDWQFEDVERIVAVADIHGAHDAFVDVLQRSAVIDEAENWTGGSSHLVIVGDVLDRGADSRASMDLIMKLEDEAALAGGAVHLVLGNHELMNLTGDLRYVADGEFAAFANDETTDRRDDAFARLNARLESRGEAAVDRAFFDEEYPPGFFAHRDAFAADGEYGAWLIEQPLLLVIDDTAFVHGGLSSAIAEIGADGVNAEVSEQVSGYVDALGSLVDAGVLHEIDNFYDHPSVIDTYSEQVAAGQASWLADSQARSSELSDLNLAFVFDSNSPLWYRGSVGCSAPVESDRLREALSTVGASRVVIGHTPTASSRIESRLNERVLRIDTGMLSDYYGGQAAALIIERENLSAIYESGSEALPLDASPRRVGAQPIGMTTAELEDLLRSADIASLAESAGGDSLDVEIVNGAETLSAVFFPARRDNFLPEVASYRLDRQLELDIVPVTVIREIDGDLGSLQLRPGSVVSETDRAGGGAGAWCPLRDQFQAMYIFDALILNEGRNYDRMLYNTSNYQLISVGHDSAWGTGRGRPAYLREVELSIGPAWLEALEALDEDLVTSVLDDVVDSRRQRALLRRRDEILDTD
ncbi:MAG: metallophosphoesterase [Gammaproteobacteria bacterium]